MLTPSQIERIEKAIRPFRQGLVQDTLTVAAELERHNISFELLRQYFQNTAQRINEAARANQASAIRQRDALRSVWPKCPDCGALVKLAAGDDTDSHWFCPKCRWGKYDPRPRAEVIKEIEARLEPSDRGA